jgi:quercetin dioxygenase-like cupin family protein
LLAAELALAPSIAVAQGKLVIEPVAQMKLKQLPPGPLYWRVENFDTLAAAKAAAGPAGIAAEVAGKAWLFTLGPKGASKGASSAGGRMVAEIGPLPPIVAPEYLLRINRAGGPPGAKTRTHTHPGAEAFYVLAGRMSQRTPHGVIDLEAGQFTPGHGADTPMQVASSGTVDLDQLVMFLVDATKPFSSPAKFE